jgi:hypothetical protein
MDDTVESILGSDFSHLIFPDARNEIRNLTDTATMDNLGYAFNSSDELTDSATASLLGYSVNSTNEFTDPTTASKLIYSIDSWRNITGFDVLNPFQSASDQLMNILSSSDSKTGPPTEYLRWTVDGSDALTDLSTENLLQGATSPTQQTHV